VLTKCRISGQEYAAFAHDGRFSRSRDWEFGEGCCDCFLKAALSMSTSEYIHAKLQGKAFDFILNSLISCFLEISDDISSYSFLTRLVSVAALLRCYSPSPHPLLRLLSHVPLSLLVTNYSLLIIRFYYVKVIKSIGLYLGGPSRLLGNLDRTPTMLRS